MPVSAKAADTVTNSIHEVIVLCGQLSSVSVGCSQYGAAASLTGADCTLSGLGLGLGRTHWRQSWVLGIAGGDHVANLLASDFAVRRGRHSRRIVQPLLTESLLLAANLAGLMRINGGIHD